MSKDDVTGMWTGFRQLLDANSYLAQALYAAQEEGRHADVEKAINRAVRTALFITCLTVRAIHERVQAATLQGAVDDEPALAVDNVLGVQSRSVVTLS
jgi:uncharacterized protein (DUF2147 family)